MLLPRVLTGLWVPCRALQALPGALQSKALLWRGSSSNGVNIHAQECRVHTVTCDTALLSLVLGSWIQRELSCACFSALTKGEVALWLWDA